MAPIIVGHARKGSYGETLGQASWRARGQPVITRRSLSLPHPIRHCTKVASACSNWRQTSSRWTRQFCRRSFGRYFPLWLGMLPAIPEGFRSFRARWGLTSLPNAGAIGCSYDCNGAM
jgi:hypothetical protein